MFNPNKDDWSKAYKKIQNLEAYEDKIKVRVASNHSEREFEFDLYDK